MRETSESESLLEASRYMQRCQNLKLVAFQRKVWGQPVYRPSGIRRADDVNLTQAFIRNYRNHPVACKPKGTRGEPSRPIVGMATDGADSLVVAEKASNAAGAKGRNWYGRTYSQPVYREEP